jgi:hypothetical protein
MNKKAINSVINKKINDWISSVDDEAIKNEIKENVIVTGGCIASMLLNESVKDFDVYFNSKEAARNVADYYVKKFNQKNGKLKNRIGYANEAFLLDGDLPLEQQLSDYGTYNWESRMINNLTPGRLKIIVRSDGCTTETGAISTENDFEDVYDVINDADMIDENMLGDECQEQYRPIFLSPNAITLSNKIQVIIRFYGTPEEIHDNYDYIHCTNYWTMDGGPVLKQEALESILAKHLYYNGSKYPLCSIIRMRKFIKRGWHINAGQIVKMCFQLSQLDLTNIDVLEDQLIGVDTCYFMNLIESLKTKMNNDESFTITNEYITSIIDKVFG